MKPSSFQIGIGLMVVGIFWLSTVFFEGERISDNFSLKSVESAELEMYFEGSDIGYFKIFMPSFSGTGVFVQILDQNYNIIFDGMVETKMSVGYFDYEKDGQYFVKVSNMSNDQMDFEIEFGETNSRKMIIPGVITLSGGILTVAATFFRLKNYRTAQPDENIS